MFTPYKHCKIVEIRIYEDFSGTIPDFRPPNWQGFIPLLKTFETTAQDASKKEHYALTDTEACLLWEERTLVFPTTTFNGRHQYILQMGAECGRCLGLSADDSGQGEFLSMSEKMWITNSWKEILSTEVGLNVLVTEMSTTKTPLMKLAFTATNSLMFGAMEQRLKRQIEHMGRFVSSLILNLELNEHEVSLACEQFGSDDAENEIRDNTANCSIREVSIFIGLLVSYLARQYPNNKGLMDAWKKLGTFMVHSMKDGAYWAEERWGVHLPTHAD